MDPEQINYQYGWNDNLERRDWFENTYLPYLINICLKGENVRMVTELQKIVEFIISFQKYVLYSIGIHKAKESNSKLLAALASTLSLSH